ncbi:hypothetical protein SAMN05444008_105211 [Cnuella takakiae]|uniref:TerB family tellurite resistance protein n=2 Tax=Cnuella takakiae TaxID=1302690 RepID=A0A1M4ZG95_9BACT|nr:hypothetical protein BUE76_21780 [Cnuella takakiae]SHF16995.1 hypothetical protein SAMN05444008_105211 [Cnuella takakiae]
MWRMILGVLLLVMPVQKVFAQEQEAQQLLLNVEKLAQMKEILEQLKKGYEVVAKGYLAVQDISAGNYNLHKVFMDGLLEVSPAVRNYYKVTDIVRKQVDLVKSCKATLRQVRAGDLLLAGELDYQSKVMGNLMKGSLKQLEALALVLTTGALRMSDEERLKAVDRVWEETNMQLIFLRSFTAETKILLVQRHKEWQDNGAIRRLQGK